MPRLTRLAVVLSLLLASSQQLLSQTPPKDLVKLPGMKSGGTVTRDGNGIPAIWGATSYDLFFLQGYTQAGDRLFQMDMSRRQASGTLAELLGQGALSSDVQFRTFGLRRAAERSMAVLTAETREALDAYAAGVNLWVTTHALPPEYGALSLTKFEPWTPLDSVTIGKLFALSLSFDDETSATVALLTYVAAGKQLGFDGTKLFFEDLWRAAPFDPFTTLPVPGTASGRVAGGEDFPGLSTTRLAAIDRAAEEMLANGALEALLGYQQKAREVPMLKDIMDGVHLAGSNEWAVSARLSATGQALVANDPHLSLGTPAIWYPLSLRGGKYNVSGNSFAGTPFAIHGQNEKLAWGSTVNYMDVTDWYSEKVVPAPGTASGLGTLYKGKVEEIVAIPQVYKMNVPGTATKDNIVVVPPGGSIPAVTLIVPRRDNGPIVSLDMATGAAISVQYTGWSATRELDAIRKLGLAQTIEEFRGALQNLDTGSQNWAVAETSGRIAYFTSAEMPLREDLQANTVAGVPPWIVRDGTGGNEWMAPAATLPADQAVPHQILPYAEMPQSIEPAQGWFANGNNDPNGVTITNNPLGRQRAGGGIYYLRGIGYDGFRGARIAQVIKQKLAAKGKLTRADMKEVQSDNVLIDAQVFVPHIVQAMTNAKLTGATPALAAFAKNPAVVAAVERLGSWDFSTPTGLKEGWDAGKPAGWEPTAAQVRASTAATIYAAWRGQVLARTIDATLSPAKLPGPTSSLAVSALRNLLEKFATRGGTGASGVNFFVVPNVPRAEDRRDIILLESIANALALLSSDAFAPAFYKSTSLDDYRWGKLHRIVFSHPLGDTFSVPSAGGAFPHPLGSALPGIPRQGGMGVVDASSHNSRASTLNGFMFASGPSRRYVGEMVPGGILGENALPGGVSGVLGNPNYLSLLPMWLTNQTYPVATQSEQAVLSLGRVSAEVTWKSQYRGQGGYARSVLQGDNAAYFYFSGSGNAEVVVKVLDPGGDKPYLLFYGGLTDYEFTVTFTNTATGKRVSFNRPAGSAAGGANTADLPPVVAQAVYWSKDGETSEPAGEARTVRMEGLEGRTPKSLDNPESPLAAAEIPLSSGRIGVSVTWKDPYSGKTGDAVPLAMADAFGSFHFGNPASPEVFAKVLDFGPGTPYVLFFAGLTDFEYTITFRNTKTGQTVPFKKEAGSYNGGWDAKTMGR